MADPAEVMGAALLWSTVGFELPSYEALARMRAGEAKTCRGPPPRLAALNSPPS
jgi:hypothetical protein